MFIRVKSPPEELAEQYALDEAKAKPFRSVEQYLSDMCLDRSELIHELSHELAELRWNYEQVCARLRKYEPDFKELPETEYKESDRRVSLL